jgi:hypothetical protein
VPEIEHVTTNFYMTGVDVMMTLLIRSMIFEHPTFSYTYLRLHFISISHIINLYRLRIKLHETRYASKFDKKMFYFICLVAVFLRECIKYFLCGMSFKGRGKLNTQIFKIKNKFIKVKNVN